MKNFLLPLLLVSASVLNGQINLKDSTVAASIINIDLGAGLPAADLAQRFGPHATAGAGYQFKTKTNWLFGVNGTFIYGNVVKDSVFSNLRNDAGFVLGTDGFQYDPILWEEGFDFKFQAGKITDLFAINPNSGLAILGGIGFLQHNIWIYIDQSVVPQLSKEYRRGYDRLSNGLMLNQYIGYYMFSNRFFVDFRGGFEFQEAFTQNRRSFDFDTRSADDAKRFDMMITLKLSWNLTILSQPVRRFYYY